MNEIRAWWEKLAGERYWLGITGRAGEHDVLATPCVGGQGIPSWRERLITCVREGDVVFHFDEPRRAIVGWSIAHGRLQEKPMPWSAPSRGAQPDVARARTIPTWLIDLQSPTLLERPIRLEEVARAQWELFPALRALEDLGEGPLYYPFSMEDPNHTHVLAGYVFKLPALFVEHFPELAGAAEHVRTHTPGRAGARARTATRPVARPTRARAGAETAGSTLLVTR